MPEKIRCELVPRDAVYDLAYELADRIRASGFGPDIVVAIARGGFAPARILCDALALHRLGSIQIVHYREAATEEGEARVLVPLSIPIEGQRVLVVDDVNDTGETLKVARTYLESLGPAEVRTAVLHRKTRSPVPCDYSGGIVEEWRWLIYPWAVFEDIGGFLRRMKPPPADQAEAERRLLADYGLSVPPDLLRRLLRPLAAEAQ
jgi:hypoxanthine phosphoribosyltransferase